MRVKKAWSIGGVEAGGKMTFLKRGNYADSFSDKHNFPRAVTEVRHSTHG